MIMIEFQLTENISMKIYILISVLNCYTLSIEAQKYLMSSKIEIEYKGFTIEANAPNCNNLNFEIINKSKDTLYLSKQKIEVTIFKGRNVVKKGKPNYGITPYFRPNNRHEVNCLEKLEYIKTIELLKNQFAEKIYYKNVDSTVDDYSTEFSVIRSIADECILIMPNESVDYVFPFFSKIFDKSCTVITKYNDNKSFYSFFDGDKLVNLKD